MNYFRLTCVAAAAVMLVACGGSDDPDRGELIDPAVVLTTLTAAQIDAGTASSGLQAISGKAKCDVKVVSLNYATVGAKAGENTNASGVMLVPAGACANDSAPLVAYARGTNALKTRTLANPQDSETFSLVAFFAAQGYAVVATDYLGYAKSSYAYHPYLDAESEAIIHRNMRAIARGRTVMIIAHRLSAIRMADRIITMENGAITESGTHDSLMASNGRYAQLWRTQMHGEMAGEPA